MRRITIDIDEDKLPFFEQLMKQLRFVKIANQDFDISEADKKKVLSRIKKSKSEHLVKWEDAKKKFTHK